MKKSGYSLVELLIAMAMLTIVFSMVSSSMGGVYFSQKRLNIVNNFNDEVRYVVERIAKTARENNIDFDRYFYEIGPDTATCATFDDDQKPVIDGQSTTACDSTSTLNCDNNKTNREIITYENIFYWDSDADDTPDKNLGGENLSSSDDPCAVAFHKNTIDWDADTDTAENPTLFFINDNRDKRVALRFSEDGTIGRIEMQTQLGSDTDNDGEADDWGIPTWNTVTSICELNSNTILGENTIENCYSAHDWKYITRKEIDVENFTITVIPDTDPFLAFRIDSVQIHPRIMFQLEATLVGADEKGFASGEEPTIALQTSVSSRVFGNTR